MRQSLSEKLNETSDHPNRKHRSATASIWGAMAASTIVLAAAVIDQTGAQSLYEYTDAAYAAHGVALDPALVYAILYAVAITTTLVWALMLAALRTRGWRPAALSAVATLVTGTVATLLFTASEYGEQIFSPVWGTLTLIPTILGIVTTVQLVRDARR